MAVVRDPRIAERADEDRIELVAQVIDSRRRDGHARLQVVIGAPRQRIDRDPAPEAVRHRPEGFQGLLRDLRANPVPGDDRNIHQKRF